MYEYRKLTQEEKAKLVKQRLAKGFPSHSPPHHIRLQTFYLLTAACYEHKHHLSQSRRQQLLKLVFEKFTNVGFNISAWVILSNHYHLLVYVSEFKKLSKIFNLIHGSTSHQWNSDDNIKGRKIWYRYSDRAIRSEKHYYTALNYIHYNPVKHNLVESPYEWEESSLHWYFKNYGREWLRDSWVKYPVKDYGKDWDWINS